ncbi:hypothetical protein VTP01DRAFT_5855 [Rhizomucor pusillus]|uniref:uncharacterized protein n=1 Tax=Rhizomucor pusillus TaxID=4840 RepID=UPI0037425951
MSEDKPKSPLFSNLCALMQSIADQRGTEPKKRRLDKYIYEWRKEYGQDFYEAFRLLLPHLDKKRYNMKETKLAKVYIDALGLGRNSAAAYDLTKFKQPSAVFRSKYAKSTGDFVAVAYSIIETRSTVQQPTQTVHDVNVLLDKLSKSEGDESGRVNIFKHIVNVYTPFEQKWLIRIILKDLKIGMTDNSMLQVYHPQAREMYALCSNLEKVCKDLQDPFKKLHQTTIQLFHPFKPQLGHKDVPKDVSRVLSNGRFYIEEKIDGERIQMHFDKKTGKFMWFSRRSIDYTFLYGDSPIEGRLAGAIIDCLRADSLILDGEMVAYDPKLDVFLPFGTLKSSAKDESIDPHKAHPCFIVFDIVYCNGNPLLDYPLSSRLKILGSVVKEKRGNLNLLPREEKSTFQDIVDALDRAISLRQEGLVIKNPGSVYEPGQRNQTWIKLKPEYINSLNDNCDLLVVGACYGSGRRGNRLSQFLCAIRDDRDKDSEDNPRFMTFATLGTGYTVDELDEFRKYFENCERYDPKRQPSWLIHPPKSNENPDVIVPYSKSVVVEVKASEIIWGNMYGAGNTLRFPRFMSFRTDKSWKDIMTYTEMIKARKEGTVGSKKRSASQQDLIGHTKKRAKTKTSARPSRSFTLTESQQGVDVKNIKVKTSLFGGYMFYVITGDETYSKQALEALIQENGGSFCQNPVNADRIIASTPNISVRSIMSKKDHDIILPRWILDCIENQDLLDLAPKYMLYTTAKKKLEFRAKMDPWGDEYTNDATEQSLQEVFQRMPNQAGDPEKARQLADEIHERYFPNTGIPGLMFQRVKAYLDVAADDKPISRSEDITMDWVTEQRTRERLHLSAADIRFYGGQITSSIEEGVTHVVMDPDNLKRLPSLTEAFKRMPLPRFVTTDWTNACVREKTMVDERKYEPKLPRKQEPSPLFPA